MWCARVTKGHPRLPLNLLPIDLWMKKRTSNTLAKMNIVKQNGVKKHLKIPIDLKEAEIFNMLYFYITKSRNDLIIRHSK